jgi:hypothetical protein
MTNFPAQARAAIDRYVGRDALTIRPSHKKAGEQMRELTRDVAPGRFDPRSHQRTARLPAPSALLPLLP